VQISVLDLFGCHIINRKYSCEKSGVLKKKFSDTCMGSLYHQQLDVAKKICTLRVHPAEEIVRQLKNNWFAVFLPKQLTVPILCRNGTSKELMMPNGVSSFHLSEGCTASFNDHLVTADFSVQTPSDFVHYEWKWDSFDLLSDGLDQIRLMPQLKALADNGIHYPTLDAIQELYIQQSYSPGWWAHFIHFVGLGTVLLIIITACVFLGIRFRRRFLRLRHQKLAEASSPLDEAIQEYELQPRNERVTYQQLLRKQQTVEAERTNHPATFFPDDKRIYPSC
jgi:hypothetical protein